MEIWKDIPGYEGHYMASSEGRIRSFKGVNPNGKIIKDTPGKKNYRLVGLWLNGKLMRGSVHRIIAKTFIPNPDNLPQVNHKNGLQNDNRVSNLEWCTAQYNTDDWVARYRAKKAQLGIEVKSRKGKLSKDAKCNSSKPNPQRQNGKWQRIEILQMDMSGTLIKTWPSMAEAERSGFNEVCIRKVCSKKMTHHKGFKWQKHLPQTPAA